MKKTLLLTLLLTITMGIQAQLNGNGFYRVKNTVTGRYVKVADNRGSLNYVAATADVGAIRTIRDFENVVSDPGTIIDIEQVSFDSTPRYDLKAQGTGVYDIIGHYVQVKETRKGGTYHCFATAYGQTVYVADEYYLVGGQEGAFEEIGMIDGKETRTREWYIQPITQDDNMYFGITPEWSDGTSYYSTFYASFPFSFYSEGMKAYYTTSIDYKNNVVIWKEFTGDVPASMPVIIASSTNDPSTNRLDIHTSEAQPSGDNLLQGVYFDIEKGSHANRVAYDAKTMRVFGQLSDGSLGFKTSDKTYIPANTAYLPVVEGAAEELKVMTEAEYEAYLLSLIDTVTVRVNDVSRNYGKENPTFTYTLENAPEGVTTESLTVQPTLTTDATKFSDVGTYAITASGAEMENCVFIYVDGTLTVTEAPVTVRVNDATRTYGEENPQFTYTLVNAPEGVTPETLLKQPTLRTTATKESKAGEYKIVASGAEMKNCTFNYVNGKLTVKKATQTLECNITDRNILIEVDSIVTFTLTTGSGLTPTCTVSDDEVIGVATTDNLSFNITGLKEGYSTILFSQPGNENYEAATSLIYYVNVTPRSGIQVVTVSADDEIYDLLGRKVEKDSNLKGIYIVGGKKVIF